ncbi:MAG: glucosidase [Planctomycetes bacterium]|nr:glucosidase [Planctomycetota bacterium]
MKIHSDDDAESQRLHEDAQRQKNWKRYGPYLSERQWGTVREDYSADGIVWDAFTYEHAASRAYRWGEDGILGISDRECRICFAVAMWNGNDSMLKERIFGLSNPEGNHGEDVKECYYYLESSPTHSYMKGLYKYPQAAFPYEELRRRNRGRGIEEREFEIIETGIFDQNKYFDVFVEYAKNAPDDICIKITIANRGPDAAAIHMLPTIWFRNTWSWGCATEGCGIKPKIRKSSAERVDAVHDELGTLHFDAAPGGDGALPKWLFTDNVTNTQRLFGAPGAEPFVKDAFHDFVVRGNAAAVNPREFGTKCAALYKLNIPAGGESVLRLRLHNQTTPVKTTLGPDFDAVFEARIRENNQFYDRAIGPSADPQRKLALRQAYAGLLWSKQFYHYVVKDWRKGDPDQPAPPAGARGERNRDWEHLYNRDVISMPDKWEFPWYAAWDLAFHMIPFAAVDPEFSKHQLLLLLREWYMHPSGQIPAYEFAFSDVNPPVHAWACWRVYKMTGPRGARDVRFLRRVFHKLIINFTWWVNRKDPDGKHIFSGGFLGLDNIGVFDRNKPLPTGGALEQADGTAWMAFYCATMLSIAIELAKDDPSYEDVASKFFEHFVSIVDAMNTLGGDGLWDDQDGFYYDRLRIGSDTLPLRVRSMVGLVPLIAVEVLEKETLDRLPGFTKRMNWFLENRRDLHDRISWMVASERPGDDHRLLAIPSRERLEKVLKYVVDEREFLSPYGIRSLSRVHEANPYVIRAENTEYRVDYAPGESTTAAFGGNSNWRGPIWFPLNYLIIEALERYHHFYGDSFTMEYPARSGRRATLQQIAEDLKRRLASLFLPGPDGRRPCHGGDPRYANDPNWKDLLLFFEHFHGDNGRGLGASHQTGWTALVTRFLEERSAGDSRASDVSSRHAHSIDSVDS